eukprot:PhM_4_TR8465/c1_g1_i1/m.47154
MLHNEAKRKMRKSIAQSYFKVCGGPPTRIPRTVIRSSSSSRTPSSRDVYRRIVEAEKVETALSKGPGHLHFSVLRASVEHCQALLFLRQLRVDAYVSRCVRPILKRVVYLSTLRRYFMRIKHFAGRRRRETCAKVELVHRATNLNKRAFFNRWYCIYLEHRSERFHRTSVTRRVLSIWRANVGPRMEVVCRRRQRMLRVCFKKWLAQFCSLQYQEHVNRCGVRCTTTTTTTTTLKTHPLGDVKSLLSQQLSEMSAAVNALANNNYKVVAVHTPIQQLSSALNFSPLVLPRPAATTTTTTSSRSSPFTPPTDRKAEGGCSSSKSSTSAVSSGLSPNINNTVTTVHIRPISDLANEIKLLRERRRQWLRKRRTDRKKICFVRWMSRFLQTKQVQLCRQWHISRLVRKVFIRITTQTSSPASLPMFTPLLTPKVVAPQSSSVRSVESIVWEESIIRFERSQSERTQEKLADALCRTIHLARAWRTWRRR